MKEIKRTGVARDGKVTVDVAAADGTHFDVLLRPRQSGEEVQTLVDRVDRARRERPLPHVDVDVLERWIEEGRR